MVNKAAAIAIATAISSLASSVARAQTPPSTAPAHDGDDDAKVWSPHPQAAVEPAEAGFSFLRGRLNGYLLGSAALIRVTPDAIPAKRHAFTSADGLGALLWQGEPYDHFSYFVHAGVFATTGGGVSIRPYNPPTSVRYGDPQFGTAANFFVDEASMTWKPTPWFNVRAGHMRAAFSLSHVALNTAQMFNRRPAPTEAFLAGPDDGVVASIGLSDERLQLRAGVYNGESLRLFTVATTRVGALFSGLLVAQPFGKMPDVPIDSRRGPFRLGLWVGALASNGRLYDDAAGYEAVDFRDYRFNLGLRASVAGVFVQGEVFRRIATNDFAGRTSMATGLYAEGTYFAPITRKVALAPVVRLGSISVDETFAPRKTTTFDSGLALYPVADLPTPSMLRIIVQYTSERRVAEDDTSYGGSVNFQLVW